MKIIKFITSIFDYRDFKKQLLYIVIISFLVSFAGARFYSLYVGNSIYIGGYQIHHFYFGMIVLSIGGLIGILTNRKATLRVASVLIGTGVGLFADEIGLLLNCTTETRRLCAYYSLDTFDVAGSITLALICFIILTDVVEKSRERGESTASMLGHPTTMSKVLNILLDISGILLGIFLVFLGIWSLEQGLIGAPVWYTVIFLGLCAFFIHLFRYVGLKPIRKFFGL